jgi:hypothetical protein
VVGLSRAKTRFKLDLGLAVGLGLILGLWLVHDSV